MAKYCKECGKELPLGAKACPSCGKMIESEPAQAQGSPIIVNVENQNVNNNVGDKSTGEPKNKWVALLLLFFLGCLGAHKFYEGKIGMGVLYLLTLGLCGIGCFIDFWVLLFKPTHYYV